MENIWLTESEDNGFRYVDLFAPVSKSPINNLLSNQCRNRKDNQRSTVLRSDGNEKFRLEKWEDAMECYNQSLCFAEIGSENVGLAFANRSACFFRMQMYDKVLVDIELAKQSQVPDRLLPKLAVRQRDSQDLIKSKLPAKRIPKLSYAPNKNWPSMADVIEVKTSPEFGRHMVSKCDIPAGKTILVEENFMMVNDCDETLCCTCFREKANFIACAKCSEVMFCSIECMNENTSHQFLCGTFFKKLHIEDQFQIKLVLLAIELFENFESLKKFVEIILVEDPLKLPASLTDKKSKYHFYLKLGKVPPTTFEILSESFKIYLNVQAIPKIAKFFDTVEAKRFLMHLVANHFLITNNNSYGTDRSTSVGLVLSMINHSCAPNVHNYPIANYRTNVTIRPVRKGQQLFSTYLSGGEKPLVERQKELHQWWGFVCKCESCRLGDRPIDVRMALSNPTFRYVLQNYLNKDHHAVVMDKCLKFLNKRANSPWSMETQVMAATLGHIYNSM